MIAGGLLALLLAASGSDELELVPLESPAPPGARYPNLSVCGNEAILSWLEPVDEGFRLGFSRHSRGWRTAVDGPKGADWFINWADFPLVSPGGYLGSEALCLWLQRTAEGKYAYGVRGKIGGGGNWAKSFALHDDDSPVEHGFVSAAPTATGWFVAWLDGREMTREGGAMSLFFRHVRSSVSEDEVVLDARVCDCCQTDIALMGEAVLVAYRDRGSDEVRDISLIRVEGSEVSEPITVHRDGWKIVGCPVNGPALAVDETTVAVAWYTEAERPEVRVAFSEDGGRSFGLPVRIDGGHPLGRVDAVWLRDGSLAVSWLEQKEDGAEWRLERLVDGKPAGSAITIASVPGSREVGFLRMVEKSGGALLAWTEKDGDFAVKTAALRLLGDD
ncbi:MAG: hypothetical protein O7B99_09385 [Planctomycetota bacterium]|nr:hypothetical protein [Planctomycetota bacterium]